MDAGQIQETSKTPTQCLPLPGQDCAEKIPIFSSYGKSGLFQRLNRTSRMRREVPVRFGEGLGVRFPRATRLVIQARYISDRLREWIETTVEGRFGLTINRTKASVRQVSPDRSDGLDFLGYRIWHAPGFIRRGERYLTANPSPKAMAAERENLRTIINPRMNCVPIQTLINRVNRQTAGWSNYHRQGRPFRQFYQINSHVFNRLIRHLYRRSQRPYRPPAGTTWWDHLTHDLGWRPLTIPPKAHR